MCVYVPYAAPQNLKLKYFESLFQKSRFSTHTRFLQPSFFCSLFMIFHIVTHLKLAKLNGLPQAEVFLKHTKWRLVSRRGVYTELGKSFLGDKKLYKLVFLQFRSEKGLNFVSRLDFLMLPQII